MTIEMARGTTIMCRKSMSGVSHKYEKVLLLS
jgi:hypothetical protein